MSEIDDGGPAYPVAIQEGIDRAKRLHSDLRPTDRQLEPVVEYDIRKQCHVVTARSTDGADDYYSRWDCDE